MIPKSALKRSDTKAREQLATGFKQQGSELIGSGSTVEVGTTGQGLAISLSADGNVLATGDAFDSGYTGATWVFERAAGSTWRQVGKKLVGTGGSGGDGQGRSVALAADGTTLAVGAPYAGGDIYWGFTGATWAFTRAARGALVQQGVPLVGTGGTEIGEQGTSVALSLDGNVLAVGGGNTADYNGAVWVFARSTGGAWAQQGAKLVPTMDDGSEVHNASFGRTVSLSADGTILAAGGSLDAGRVGAVWVFTRSSSGQWAQQGSKLVGTGAIGDYVDQGSAVALSADGTTLAIGGPGDNSLDNGGAYGATWIFTQTAGTWKQQGEKLVATGDAGSQGQSVAFSGDGNVLAVGGQDSSVTYDQQSSVGVWIFKRSTTGQWAQQGSALNGTFTDNPSGDVIDHAVALSASGTTLAVGYDDPFTGGVVIFTGAALTCCYTTTVVYSRMILGLRHMVKECVYQGDCPNFFEIEVDIR